jgi:uncharacterized cofD-like protein
VRVVGLGGGHGLAQTLRSALLYADEIEAVVSVADDGGSSGRLTKELGIPPPGDIRNCLVALAKNEDVAQLFQHRFDYGALSGHTIGNLVIAALTREKKSFADAVSAASKILDTSGRVHPATTTLVSLGARVGGSVLHGQEAVASAGAGIECVYLVPPDALAHPPAVEAIRAADQIVLGPGSLYTSLIPALLVPGIGAAVRSSEGRRVFVCNTRVQRGETEGLDVTAHVAALLAHAGDDCVDVVLAQCPPVEIDGVQLDRSGWRWPHIDLVQANVASSEGIHDRTRLSRALAGLG